MTTSKKKKLVTEIEKNRGGNASVGFAGNVSPVLNLPESVDKVREEYQRLKSKDAKREFFSSGLTRIDRNMPGAWARLYWFLDLCRREKWYWKEQGFDTFESFWRENGRYAFEEVAKLEAMFNFAKLAYPELFELNVKRALDLWAETKNVSRRAKSFASPNGSHLRNKNGESSQPFAYLDLDLHSEEFQKGFCLAYSGSAIRRYRRLKQLAPKIAKQVLEGKFVRIIKGEPKPDLTAAEKAAGLYKKPSAIKTSKKFASRIEKFSDSELESFLKVLSSEARKRLRSSLNRNK